MPTILNDDIFKQYGGQIGNSTAQQRTLAYEIAEEQVSQFLNTPLAPTLLSGSYAIPYDWGYLSLDTTYLRGVLQVGYWRCEQAFVASGTVLSQYWSEQGVVPFNLISCELFGVPDDNQLTVSYIAGLPTGTFGNPVYMQGLVQLAQTELFRFGS